MAKAKWVLVLKAAGLVVVALLLKLLVIALGLDLIALTPLITALVGGVIFTLAIIFTGVLADFKESEKMPAELAASARSLYKDFRVVVSDQAALAEIRGHFLDFVSKLNAELKDGNRWDLDRLEQAIDRIDEDIRALPAKGVPLPYIARMRNEVTNIERMSNRIDTVMKTTFIPAAYAIAEVVVAASILTLLFTKVGSAVESVALFGFSSFILVAMVFLLKDIDNPFEGHAKVDLSQLHRLEDQFRKG